MNLNKNKYLPVVFIHLGIIPKYLINAINQALAFDNKVVLITDSEEFIAGVEIVKYKDLNVDYDEFKSFYVHMSSNSYQFEFVCIYRWFLLKNYLNKYSVETILYLDSDVFLYSNTIDIANHYTEYSFAYGLPFLQEEYYWAASACCSLWNKESINDFCKTIKDYYTTDKILHLKEKWKFHQDKNILGGICDMTFLYLYSDRKGFLNLSEVVNGCSFDFNNAIAANYKLNEYDFKQGNIISVPTKNIDFVNGVPYCENLISKEKVRFFALTEYAKLLFNNEKRSFVYELRRKLYYFKKWILTKF